MLQYHVAIVMFWPFSEASQLQSSQKLLSIFVKKAQLEIVHHRTTISDRQLMRGNVSAAQCSVVIWWNNARDTLTVQLPSLNIMNVSSVESWDDCMRREMKLSVSEHATSRVIGAVRYAVNCISVDRR